MFDVAPLGSDTPSGGASIIPPKEIPVEVGATNDSSTEIVSGLKEGDNIVTRTLRATAAKTTAPGIFGGGGGGGVRLPHG